ncbi:hypothetical protein E1A91_D09G201900v1, partial [Gossypium mustelinum]
QGNGGFRPRGRGERYSNNSRPQCQLCGKIGHLVSKCFHRFNASFTGISDSTGYTQASSEGNRISQCLQATPAVVVDPAWYPDTGATGHLTHDSTCLQHSNPATGIVQVDNGSCIPIINTGIATFSTYQKELHLNKLFYAPDITKNLISVSQFTKDNNVSFEFFPN